MKLNTKKMLKIDAIYTSWQGNDCGKGKKSRPHEKNSKKKIPAVKTAQFEKK